MATQRGTLYDPDMKKTKTKRITVRLGTRAGDRALGRMLEAGWEVVATSTRGALSWKPGYTDIVLRRRVS